MDEDLNYFYNKAKGRINGYLWICIIGSIIAEFFVIKYNAEGRYDDSYTVLLVPVICFGFIVLYNIVLKGLLRLSCKSQTWATLGILLSWPMGLFFYWPMLRYHRGDTAGNGGYTDKAFKLTVRAYQKAWARQCFAQRVLYPLVLLVALIAAFLGFEQLLMSNSDASLWICGIIMLVAYGATIYLIGGVRDVTVTTDYYNVEIGTGIFDYGEVKMNKSHSTTKDDTDVSFLAMIIAIPLTPVLIMGVLIIVCSYVFLQVIRIFFPTGGRRSIYLHKRKLGVHPAYIPGSEGLLNVIFIVINKILGLIFRVNLVNDDFWLDGMGPKYILEHLSRRNVCFLEKELDKVERKCGYIYNF